MSMRERIAIRLVGLYAQNDGPLDGLTEADAVLDELMTPTEGMVGASVKTEQVDAICWVSSLLGTGVHSAQDVTVSSYTSMIKAAKDGK